MSNEKNYAVGIYEGTFGCAASDIYKDNLTRAEAKSIVRNRNKQVPAGIDVSYYIVDKRHDRLSDRF